MIPPNGFPDPPAWLDGDGAEPAIVLSSRIRLARNVKGIPFSQTATDEQKETVFGSVEKAARETEALRESRIVRVDRSDPLENRFLLERRLISQDLAAGRGPRGVAIGEGERVSVLINEEDHMRIQSMRPGFELDGAWRTADRIDDEMSERLDVAYTEEWGFLTACPTNTGTGMRASVLIHLPALALTKQISKVLRGITQVGLAVRGMFGEHSEMTGNFYQISNQTTLGVSEADTLDSLGRVTRQIIDHERSASESLLESFRPQVEDKVYRAYGLLTHCRVVSSQEVLSLLSAVRFGATIGILEQTPIPTLNRLMIETLPAHLQKEAGGALEPPERDVRRANRVRAMLSSN
ncbi:MAG: protein arginine kinase [Candidatus Eisenbacteria bacterium]|nr:protein arginine kinase [Candidatus Eisenbacteria bacterium]